MGIKIFLVPKYLVIVDFFFFLLCHVAMSVQYIKMHLYLSMIIFIHWICLSLSKNCWRLSIVLKTGPKLTDWYNLEPKAPIQFSKIPKNWSKSRTGSKNSSLIVLIYKTMLLTLISKFTVLKHHLPFIQLSNHKGVYLPI